MCWLQVMNSMSFKAIINDDDGHICTNEPDDV